MTTREVANFFWHGPSLSLYETHCIKSFVKHGFEVNLWTFAPINVPEGVTIQDASKFYSVDDIQTFTQRGKQGCLAAFSDAFRYSVLKNYGGWWFDTDCLCLKDQSEFTKLTENRSIVAGYENGRNDINGAAIKFISDKLLNRAIEMMEQKLVDRNRCIGWGEIGPKLITRLVAESNIESEIYSLDYFYPVHCKHAQDAINPEKIEYMENRCANSYIYHCWNEMLVRAGVDKNIFPPEGSYLSKQFLKLDQ